MKPTVLSFMCSEKNAPNETTFLFWALLAGLAFDDGWREAVCSYSGMAYNRCALAPRLSIPVRPLRFSSVSHQMHEA